MGNVTERIFIWLTIAAAMLLVLGVTLLYPAHGRPGGDFNNTPEVREWYRTLMRPDPGYTSSSCCGEADAYWCDDIYVKDGNTFCKITDDRPDYPLGRPHRPIGTIIKIPPEKMKWSSTDPQRPPGNPTGHSVVFLTSGADPAVYCFVPDVGV